MERSVKFNVDTEDVVVGVLPLEGDRMPRPLVQDEFNKSGAKFSPDDKWVVFARNHNLFMMDAANYAKALKKADDPSIVETQITKDGEEDFGYGIDQQQQQRHLADQ